MDVYSCSSWARFTLMLTLINAVKAPAALRQLTSLSAFTSLLLSVWRALITPSAPGKILFIFEGLAQMPYSLWSFSKSSSNHPAKLVTQFSLCSVPTLRIRLTTVYSHIVFQYSYWFVLCLPHQTARNSRARALLHSCLCSWDHILCWAYSGPQYVMVELTPLTLGKVLNLLSFLLDKRWPREILQKVRVQSLYGRCEKLSYTQHRPLYIISSLGVDQIHPIRRKYLDTISLGHLSKQNRH